MQNYPQDRSTSSHYGIEPVLACGRYGPNRLLRKDPPREMAIWNGAGKEDKPVVGGNESQLWQRRF